VARLRGEMPASVSAAPPRDKFSHALEALQQMDFGQYRKGLLAGWGIDKRDATADRRLIEFCLSLPVEKLLKDGVRRPLARAALADRVPQEVLDEPGKGYQAADWHVGLSRDLAGAAALVESIAADERASTLLDSDRMRALVREWPEIGWDSPEMIGRYRIALLQALSAGQFMLAASDRQEWP
jgi:asparagine synthase (glutamine-hydrolysing)